MSEATATKATKNFIVPEFGTVPVADMPKVSVTKYISEAERRSQAAFDKMVKDLRPNQAGWSSVPEGSSFRTVMGRIRGAVKRSGLELSELRADQENRKVYVIVKAAQNGAAPIGAR